LKENIFTENRSIAPKVIIKWSYPKGDELLEAGKKFYEQARLTAF